jgi:hypothetical protein
MNITLNYLLNRSCTHQKTINSTYIELNKIASLRQGIIVSNKSSKTMRDLGEDLGVVIFAPKNKFVARASSFYDANFKLIKDFLTKKIDELRQINNCSDEDIKPIIFGGASYDSNTPLAKENCKLVDIMEEACVLENTEPTIITGKYGTPLDFGLNSYISDKYISFWGKLIDKIKFDTNSSQLDMQKSLEQIFEYVKIPKNTKIEVNQKKINV